MFTPAYIERWSHPFLGLHLHKRLGITFEEFLHRPGYHLRRFGLSQRCESTLQKQEFWHDHVDRNRNALPPLCGRA